MYIPVYVMAGFVLGAVIGAYRARRRGGRLADMLHYAAIHAIPLTLLGLFLTIYLDRAGQ